MTDPAFLPATAQAELVRTRRIGCLELLGRRLARVARHDGAIRDRTTVAVAGILERAWQAHVPPPGWM
ncbi:MAG TPA: hypothetical protein VGC80_00540 [Acetobacteraceae bacterium]